MGWGRWGSGSLIEGKNLSCNSTIHKLSSNIAYFVYRPFEYVFILEACLHEESVTFHRFPSLSTGYYGFGSKMAGEKK